LFTRSEGGSYESGSETPAAQFVIEAILQPFLEHARIPDERRPSGAADAAMRCPRCGGLPVAAVLREAGHGAKRQLLCALCLHEWECLRIVCAACGENRFESLPVYATEQFPHVRIDACDACRRYVKTIDLTKDGHAVPCVDDIATVSLDLWAREQGYAKVKANVLGV
jgi:FdhE protein